MLELFLSQLRAERQFPAGALLLSSRKGRGSFGGFAAKSTHSKHRTARFSLLAMMIASSHGWIPIGGLIAGETNVVRIGMLLPPEEPPLRSLREAALLAQEQAGKSANGEMNIIIRGRVGQWGADGVEAARMVADDEVQGLIAPPDGAASHLTLQVSGRTAVPVVTLCADSSVSQTGVPWLLRIVPRTTDEAKALFENMPVVVGCQGKRWLAVVPDGRAGREISRDLAQAALSCGIRLETMIESSETAKAGLVGSNAEGSRPDFVLLWLDPVAAGNMTRKLKTSGYRGILAGPGRLQCSDFMIAAGNALDGFVVPEIVRSVQSADRWRLFQLSYQERWGHAPDTMAGMSYDAAMLLSYLLQQPWFQNPPHRLAPGFQWSGVTGELTFDTEGNRTAKFDLLQAHDGRFRRVAKPTD